MTDYDALATERAHRLRPELDPAAGPGAARTHRSLVRMLSVAQECSDLRRAGVRNAITTIALRRGISYSTVSMLLHRARRDLGIDITAQPATPALGRALQIVADWYASSEGRDVLIEDLEAAGYQLPEADR